MIHMLINAKPTTAPTSVALALVRIDVLIGLPTTLGKVQSAPRRACDRSVFHGCCRMFA